MICKPVCYLCMVWADFSIHIKCEAGRKSVSCNLIQAALAEPVYVMRPAARGLIALGSHGGAVALADPRAGFKVQHNVVAHAAGLADMDARADSLATCGYGTRQGTVVAENYVKVRTPRAAVSFFSVSFLSGMPAWPTWTRAPTRWQFAATARARAPSWPRIMSTFEPLKLRSQLFW